jgi:hypothetical protein
LPQGCPYNEAIRLFAFPYQPTLLRFFREHFFAIFGIIGKSVSCLEFQQGISQISGKQRLRTVSRTSLQSRLCLPQHMLSTFLGEEFVDFGDIREASHFLKLAALLC